MTNQITDPLLDQTPHKTLHVFSDTARTKTTHRFLFRGTGMGYFQIWIVNLVLTIITLGFYSPWAKVRRLRYFYGNTVIDGRAFDFTANPKNILIGRLIAVGLYLAISVFGQFSPEIAIIGSLALFVVMPWLIRSSMRFMAKNSQYNNVRFSFQGSLGRIYWLSVLTLFLNAISFGLLLPLTWWMFKKYQFDHLYFGRLKFNLNTTVLDMYKACIVPLVLIIATLAVVAGLGLGLLQNLDLNDENSMMMGIGFIIATYAVFLFVLPLMQGYVHKAIWGKLTLGDNALELINFSPLKFAFIILTNYIAIALSLGLLYPWAKVRLYRYKTETLSLIAVDDFTVLTTPSVDNVSPIGEEIADVFDFDVSW